MEWRKTLFFTLMIIYMVAVPVSASQELIGSAEQQEGEVQVLTEVRSSESDKLIIDAGLIEWGEGYLTATEGFIFRFAGKTATGDTLFYDLNTGLYWLDQADFTACKKKEAHYKIRAKRVEFVPGKYLAFSGVQIQIGQLRLPFLPRLVLPYEEGKYQFPDWLPELTYGKKGIGLKLKAEYLPNSAMRFQGAVEVTTRGGVDLEGAGQYRLSKDLTLGGDVAYDEHWMGGVKLNWRESFTTALGVDATGTVGDWIPKLTVEMVEKNMLGISYNFHAGVTLVTENESKERYNKVYAQARIRDAYMFGDDKLSWSITGNPIWVEGYQPGLQSQVALQLEAKFDDHWKGQLGYGRTDHWGGLPERLYSATPEEYVQAGLGFHWRNRFDEGWDIETLTQYSLENRKLNFANTKIVKAYDCFEVEMKMEWVEPQATIGFRLKY